MGGMEAVITGLTDDFKILKRNRKLFTFATAILTFLFALLCITNVSVQWPAPGQWFDIENPCSTGHCLSMFLVVMSN